MEAETVDYLARQKAKIQDITPPITIHTHTINPRTGRRFPCVFCREARKQRKHQREQTAIQVLGDISKEVIRETGSIISQSARGFFNMERGVAQNPDPVAQAVFITAQLVVFAWFIESYPNLSHASHLDKLLLPLHKLLNKGPIDISSGLASALAKVESAIASFEHIGIPPLQEEITLRERLRRTISLTDTAQKLMDAISFLSPIVNFVGWAVSGDTAKANEEVANIRIFAVRAGPFPMTDKGHSEAEALLADKQPPKSIFTGQFDKQLYAAWTE